MVSGLCLIGAYSGFELFSWSHFTEDIGNCLDNFLNYKMGDPVTPLDRKVTESLFGLSLRGTANLAGNESAQFLTEVSTTRQPWLRFSSLSLILLRHGATITMSKETQTAG